MSDTYGVFVEGIDLGAALSDVQPAIVKAARAAINATAAKGRTAAAIEIGRQINFPAQYLTPSGGRLAVSQQATDESLQARISARGRPTSLARFLISAPTVGKQVGVSIAVKPGLARYLARAFIIKLRSGNSDTLGNFGLAVRTDGTPPMHAYKPKRLGANLWLLYGPSVDQVFKGAEAAGTGVRDKIAPGLGLYLEQEFNRLLGVSL